MFVLQHFNLIQTIIDLFHFCLCMLRKTTSQIFASAQYVTVVGSYNVSRTLIGWTRMTQFLALHPS